MAVVVRGSLSSSCGEWSEVDGPEGSPGPVARKQPNTDFITSQPTTTNYPVLNHRS